MLPKDRRLNLKKDFKWVAAGKRATSRNFSLFIKYGENGFPRMGVATSKKNFKNAVDRNRARRLLSKAFENIYSILPYNVNIIALPKQGLIEVKSEDLSKELEDTLKREGILGNKIEIK